MSSNEQDVFMEKLSNITNEALKYSTEAAEFVNKNVDQISEHIKEALAKAEWLPEWIPEQFRPQPPPPPPVLTVPLSALERVQSWISRHKILTGMLIVATGTVAYRTYRASESLRKTRRAKRARTGGRVEVVIIAGSPALPITRSLALDLERKGFIVFIVCNNHDDEDFVKGLARPDIRPFGIDITDPTNAGNSIEHFARYLQTPHASIPNGKKHHVQLKSVILIPSLNYHTSPIATIPPSSFADIFNTHLLHPILTIQAFLPLLTTRLATGGPTDLIKLKDSERKESSPKVLVFTPSIISSINPPFHAPEATVCSALTAFTEVLAGELNPLQIPVTHIQLGTFDFTGFTPASQQNHPRAGGPHGLLPAPGASETLSWPDAAKHTYGRNYVAQSSSAVSAGRIRGMRGSSLKELHNVVFDVLDGSITSSTVRVGLGANVYGFVGRFVPRTIVSFMMGIRKVDELAVWQSSSAHGSPRSAAESSAAGSDEDMMTASMMTTASDSFVSVQPDVADANVWKEG
ncbi:hypothetical protein QBC35DRAFT_486053 [Podospora australis]|uniref:Uncharacterized protein n=1 Tax=Podospora australis TaxID=1536484 RepID=A0AAN7AK99_9PEZI|nr:hypothetical protein QBC35DRAFT_486053 [Podospora australis]